MISNTTFETSTGTYTLTVHLTLKFSLSLAAGAGGPGHYAFSSGEVGADVFLDDETNSTGAYLGETYNDYTNSSSPTTHSYSLKETLTTSSFQFVAGHEYIVELGVSADVDTDVSAHESASASLNMYSSGKGVTVTSIVVP